MGLKQNKLASEKSPYLLQHAGNPVDWYPWGEMAFSKARDEGKPVFLSIGYSTCHWCHVMAHESFEDKEVADLLNDAFICVKVDREERPDIDSIYMSVAQMMTGSGGWPLTILMTPDKEPFLAATYIPKETRFGRLGLLEFIPKIKQAWETRQDELIESAGKIVAALQGMADKPVGADLGPHLLSEAYQQLSEIFDSQNGGFGNAPKFPNPQNLLFLLRYWKSTGDPEALRMVEETLTKMRLGGIFDHVGFGFHRYSTDAHWLVPHFEKMLYDQAMLVMAFTETWQATGKPQYQQVAREILTYVMRDMTSPEGGFYSAEDADSEGVEGKFYVWTEEEINSVLAQKEAELMTYLFNVSHEGNFADESTGRKTSENILHLTQPMDKAMAEKWEAVREKLFTHRQMRVHPHKDDKILTDWNGLMIAALAKAGQAFGRQSYIKSAERAAEFILKKMRNPEGRLLHRYRDGEATYEAYADDYAFFIWGMLELYESTFDADYLQKALDLNTEFEAHFWDKGNGGFFSTSDDGEAMLVRQKEVYDGPYPSANSVAMLNLLRLGRITANPEFENKASQVGKAFSETVAKVPVAFTHLMCALSFSVGPAYEVVIAGDFSAQDTQEMLLALRQKFIPSKVVLFNPSTENHPQIHQMATYLKDQHAINDRATAYICRNCQCNHPTTDITQMVSLLGG